ncbi:AAA family ATPase [Paenarthrobacter ureafaciens]|uniref:AAA family ATPase n=1 Tax=Paenarthrobacter ureafaciens TaxID=37931 RepID=UPI0014099635|nr:AAA family ATPase [Paenarthrobacter ureafaciens]MCX8455336.1 AAA family ATPase [Paenarthrobacter ureafaciens]MCY0974063.1 AAA family ATPase [Paenarthrobacter ureafaciens]
MTPEELVIGACILTPDSIRFAAGVLEPTDFKSKTHADIFRAIVRLRKSDEPIEPFSVWTKAQELGAKGIEVVDLHRMVEGVGSAEHISFYADQVKEASSRRKLAVIATSLMREAADETRHPSQAAQAAAEAIKNLATGGAQRMTTKTLEAILAVQEDHDWLIPDLLERGDRLILTGFEGGGKTTWIRQLLICMAAGIHPTTWNMLDQPLKILVVDAENTEAQWRAQVRGMTAKAAAYGITDPAPNIEIYAKGRIDITKDATLGEVHRLVDEHSPDVLAIGPLYKMVSTGINNDQEAAPLIMALDSLRDRGVALIMEGHASKGNSQNLVRDLAPRGSAALMGWPEFGFGLHPDANNPDMTLVTRWRGDREAGRLWPRELWRGGAFPWTGDTVTARTRQNYLGFNDQQTAA